MKQELDYEIDPQDRVPFWRKIAFAAATPPEPLLFATIANFLVLFYNGVLGVSGTAIGLALFVPRLLDAFVDPIVGRWSDHHQGARGRRRPFLLWGGVLTAMTFALLWTPPRGADANGNLIYLFVVANIFYLCSTLYLIPYHALALELTSDYKERTSIMLFRRIAYSIGDITIGAVPLLGVFLATRLGRPGDEAYGFGAVGALFGAITAVLVVVTFFGVRERKLPCIKTSFSILRSVTETLKNILFVRIALSYLFLMLTIYLLGALWSYLFIYFLKDRTLIAINQIYHPLISIAVGVLGMRFANRLGKVVVMQWSLGSIAAACVSVPFAFQPEYRYLFLITSTLFGIGWGGVLITFGAILADIVDVDELSTGQRREGAYSGVQSFIYKLGVAGATPLIGVIVDVAGFVPGAGSNQDPAVFERMQWTVAGLGGSLASIALLMMVKFPLTPARAIQVRRELEARRGVLPAAR